MHRYTGLFIIIGCNVGLKTVQNLKNYKYLKHEIIEFKINEFACDFIKINSLNSDLVNQYLIIENLLNS
jgi:hypothetical protein